MRLLIHQVIFGTLAMLVALAVIFPSFVVVHELLAEGYLVALVGVIGLAALLIFVYSRRYKGGAPAPPDAGETPDRADLSESEPRVSFPR